MSQLADNVVVIGKGKLLADTSMSKFIAGNVASTVYIRVSDTDKLAKVLDKNKISYTKDGKGLELEGVKTDEVGKLAFEQKLQVLELTTKSASLEEAFLEVTAGSEEFSGRSEDKK